MRSVHYAGRDAQVRLRVTAKTTMVTMSRIITRNSAPIRYITQPGVCWLSVCGEGGVGGEGCGGTGAVGGGVVAGTGTVIADGAAGCIKAGGGSSVVNEPVALQALLVSELMALTFQ